jgi:hypothetical protein
VNKGCTVCGLACRDKNLMCRYHWMMVPETMRREIWRTLHQWEIHPGDRHRLTDLRAAQEMATAFVRAKLQARAIPAPPAEAGEGPH